MSDIPDVEDPILAVVLDRLNRLQKDLREHRDEVRNELAEVRKTQAEHRDEVAKVTKLVDKANGGWLVLVGLGALLLTLLGFWERLAKLWHTV